jgi:hypothetical protein
MFYLFQNILIMLYLLIFQIGKAKLMYQEFQNNNISLFFGFMNGSFGIQNFILCFWG